MCSMAVLTPQSKRPITKAKLWYLVKPTLLPLDQVQRQRRQWHPTPVLWPGKSHGWRSLVGCSPWGHELSDFTFTFHFHALEKEMAAHSSVLAWRIPGMGEPGGLPSMGSHRVGYDWSDLAAAAGTKVRPFSIVYPFSISEAVFNCCGISPVQDQVLFNSQWAVNQDFTHTHTHTHTHSTSRCSGFLTGVHTQHQTTPFPGNHYFYKTDH